MTPLFQIQKIHKSFGDLHLINDLSFSIEEGVSHSIQGPSGCGKSTLFSLLTGMDSIDSGEILYKEKEIQSLSRHEWAKLRGSEMGIVFQDFHLIPSLDVLDNVLIVDKLLKRPIKREEAMQALQNIGLGERLHHSPQQLSGGEQQRVAIVRSLHHNPQVLFADEPTGSLDEESAEHIEEVFFNTVNREGLSLVLITHNPKLAQKCSRQFKMHQGTLTHA